MSAILKFVPSSKSVKRSTERAQSAQIVIFPGVRYERRVDECGKDIIKDPDINAFRKPV